jgi:hypothetical protein
MLTSCLVKQLPESKRVKAARRAVEVNPANAPLPQGAVALGITEPGRLAVIVSKFWGAKGVKLGVTFLDNPNAATRSKILTFANKWNARANISFHESAQGEVRLARTRGDGYWSYLGTDILSVPSGQPTMNLDSFTENTPDAEYDRVVPHEYGHAAGFPHEHERAEIIALLDRAKTEAYFRQHYGWSPEETDQQVFTPLSPTSIRATAQADARSIMCYDFPPECTKSGQPVPGGMVIDELDYQFAATLYPLDVAPPPPPPPPGPAKPLFTVRVPARIPKGGRVSFAAPVAVAKGYYAWAAVEAPGGAHPEAQVDRPQR